MNPKPKHCRTCDGTGEVRPSYIDRDTCPACKGVGTVTARRERDPLAQLFLDRRAFLGHRRSHAPRLSVIAARYADQRRRVMAFVRLPGVAA